MCSTCGHENGTTLHLLYWQWKWLIKLDFKKFFKTWYHIFNRKAYRKWKAEQQVKRKLAMLLYPRGEYARMGIQYDHNNSLDSWIKD